MNSVMKYLNFHSSGSKLDSVTRKFTKNRTGSFHRISPLVLNSNIEKCTLIAASEDNCILEISGLLQLYIFLLFSIFSISNKDITIDRDFPLFFYISAGL